MHRGKPHTTSLQIDLDDEVYLANIWSKLSKEERINLCKHLCSYNEVNNITDDEDSDH